MRQPMEGRKNPRFAAVSLKEELESVFKEGRILPERKAPPRARCNGSPDAVLVVLDHCVLARRHAQSFRSPEAEVTGGLGAARRSK
jgi:hypothetical protein